MNAISSSPVCPGKIRCGPNQGDVHHWRLSGRDCGAYFRAESHHIRCPPPTSQVVFVIPGRSGLSHGQAVACESDCLKSTWPSDMRPTCSSDTKSTCSSDTKSTWPSDTHSLAQVHCPLVQVAHGCHPTRWKLSVRII